MAIVKAVFFDIDNTLYNFDKAHNAAMEELLKYGKKEFSLGPDSMKMLLSKAQCLITERLGTDSPAIHNRLIRFQCFMELLKYPVFTKAMEMNQIYWDTLLSVITPEEGLVSLLEALHSLHVPMGIGSDQNSYIQYHKLQKLGILEYFSFIVISEEAGMEKPAPGFFKLCIEKAHCSPEECIFIGDNIRKDVTGALQNGLYGIWYNTKQCENKKYPIIHSYKDCIKAGCIQLGSNIIIKN